MHSNGNILQCVAAANKVNVRCICRWGFVKQVYTKDYDLIESIAANSYQWKTSRVNLAKKVAGVHKLSDVSALSA